MAADFRRYICWRHEQSGGPSQSSAPIWHAKLTQTYRRMLSSLDIRLPDRLIAQVGPSRVGKSRITHLLVSDYAGGTFQSGQSGAVRTIVRVAIPNHNRDNRFSPKAFWLHALHKIEHVMAVSGKLDEKRGRLTEDQLADMFGRALKCLRTHWLIIDEAQHVNWALKGQAGACRFLDGLKSFSEQYEVPIILSGTPQLIPTIDSTPHLAGRVTRIFHERYYQDRDEDVSEYCRLITEALSRVPCCKEVRSNKTFAALITASSGIPGLLFKIIDAAVTEANSRDASQLSAAHIRYAIRCCPISAEMEAEIELGDMLASVRSVQLAADVTAEPRRGKQSSGPKLKPFQSKPSRIVPEEIN